MGNICSYFTKDKKEYQDSLIRNIYCPKCRITYLSNYEYNNHIVSCNRINGDL